MKKLFFLFLLVGFIFSSSSDLFITEWQTTEANEENTPPIFMSDTPWEPGEVLYVGGETTRTTTRTIKMYNATDLTYMNVESLSYGGDIYSMFEKDGVIYIGGAFTNKVRMYNATTLQYIRESPSYGGYIRTMFEKDGVIYVGGYTTNKVRMYNATTLQYMNVESPSYGGYIRNIIEKDGVIYVGGTDTQKVRMYNATTLQYMNVESPSYGGDILTMLEKDGVIYVGGYTQKVRMYNATTLQYIRESPSYGNINSMLEKDGVIYVSGDTRTIRMYNATTLQYMNVESPNHGSGISCIIEKDGVIYVGGGGKIKMYNATTLEYMNIESPSYGKNVFTMVLKGINYNPLSLKINSPKNKTYYSETIPLDINVTVDEPNEIDKVWYSLDGGETNHIYLYPIDMYLDNGYYVLDVWANNTIGIVSYDSIGFTVDAPEVYKITINSPINQTYNYTEITIDITANQKGQLWYDWNGTTVNYTNKHGIVFPSGTHILTAWGESNSNETDYKTVVFTIKDKEIPVDTYLIPLATFSAGVGAYILYRRMRGARGQIMWW